MAKFDPYHKWLGIPPREQPAHHYRLLGISLFEEDPDVIEAAADRCMAFVQQCALGKHQKASQQILNELSAARVCLLIAEEKEKYDTQLRAQLKPSTPEPVSSDEWDEEQDAGLLPAHSKNKQRTKRSTKLARVKSPPQASQTLKQILKRKLHNISVRNLKITGGVFLVILVIMIGFQFLGGEDEQNSQSQTAVITHPVTEAESESAKTQSPPKKIAESLARNSEKSTTHPNLTSVVSSPKPVPAANHPALLVAPFSKQEAKAEQAAWAKYLKTDVVKINSIGMKLMLIPPGEFMMGSDSDGSSEKPTHQVNLTTPFELGVYEVTQEQYKLVMGTNPSESKGADNPVDGVSWEDAVEFCSKLSEMPTEEAAGYLYRLPTEAEWEYACRAGTTTPFSFGDSDTQLDECAWYGKNSNSMTHPVGQKKPNPWGLYDMHGNVGEWCQDWYGDYPSEAVTDPTGQLTGSLRVHRGGSWRINSSFCSSAIRYGSSPWDRGFNIGFRVIRSSVKQADGLEKANKNSKTEKSMSKVAEQPTLSPTNNSAEKMKPLQNLLTAKPEMQPESEVPDHPKLLAAPFNKLQASVKPVPKNVKKKSNMDDADFVPLFNGKNLQGWKHDRRFWRVQNGILLGKKRLRSGPSTYAATKDVFDDFILKLKFKLNSGDSGIQFGGKLLPGLNTMTGSHLNISYEKNLGEIGQLYVNKQLFSVLTVPKRRELANAINVTGWNDCTISAKGNRVGATINGIVVVDQEYQDRKSGSIGFQLHGSGADIAFKDIMIKKIEATTSDSNESHVIVLFNGKTLKGWKALDNKKTDGWGVKNGELILVPRKGTPSLVSEDKFDDFEFECEFWLDKKSNSGIFLRGRYELQLLDDGNYQNLPLEIKCGAIHGQLPPSRAVYRGPNRWNTLSVRLERKTVTVVLNGMKIIDHRYINKVSNGAIDDLEDQQGPIVLQSHSGSARFKNITIRRLAR